MDKRPTRLAPVAQAYLRQTLALIPLLILVRTYELLASRSAHALPRSLPLVFARGVLDDLTFAGIVAATLAIPVIGLGLLNPRAGRIVHRVALIAIVVIAVGLARFFSITFVPLGADFWGYSLSDLVATSAASSGGWLVVIPFIIGILGAWAIIAVAERMPLGLRGSVALAGITLALAIGSAFLSPRSHDFNDEAGYLLALNKPKFFALRSIRFAIDEARAPSRTFGEYPLLAAPSAPDVLGPLLTRVDRPPNIVFLIVEGLGRDFVGRNAEYGGFTPFIDSLTARGLFWENFLANAGRTFGILPSMLGSLPFARGGFMDLGESMPTHLTLIRLLGQHGYATSYFTGTSGSFDRIDAFLERQGIGRFSDQSSFPARIAKQPGGAGGFSWGYADRDMLGYSLEQLGPRGPEPRLDVYQTVTTHEPFIPPNAEAYRRRFDERLAALNLPPARRSAYASYANVFSTLLYTDDAIAFFIREYAKRPEYARTIFVITGDHRLIPIPFSTRLSRYRVPFLIVSPMVKTPRVFSSVSSHLDVTPTLAAYLSANYALPLPPKVPWLGAGIDTATAFRNVHAIPFMRTKNELDDFMSGPWLLSGDQVFALGDGLTVERRDDSRARDSLKAALAEFRQLNRYVTSGEHIYPENPAERVDRLARIADDSVFVSLKLKAMTPEQQLSAVQKRVETRDFRTARAALRRMLRTTPTYHDARVLFARTYAWENKFDEARAILADLYLRSPNYFEGRLASIDVEIWDTKPALALQLIDSATTRFGAAAELLYARGRAFELLGRKREALAAVDSSLRLRPDLPGAAEVRARLVR